LILNVQSGRRPSAERRVFRQPFVLIGRNPKADLRLNHPQVSPWHAYLQVVAGRVLCMDLQSQTGTHWTNGPQRSGCLGPGQSIQIGPFTISMPEGSDAREADRVPRAEILDLPHPASITLEPLAGTKGQSPLHVNRAVTLLGKSLACNVQILDSSVADFHCCLLRTPLGAWLIDLTGGKSTWVNGQPVRWRELEHQDRLQVGQFLFRVRDDLPAAAGGDTEPSIFCGDWEPDPLSGVTSTVAQAGPAQAIEASLVKAQGETNLPLAVAARPTADGRDGPAPNQMVLFQQQMMEQFQQTMMTMLGMFRTLREDQMRQAQEQMEQFQQLRQEWLRMQTDLTRQLPSPGPHPAAKSLPGADWSPGPANRVESTNAPRPRKAVVLNLPTNGAGGTGGGGSDGAIHGWLQDRLASLQREQPTPWRKFVNLFRGK
jgi:pSer/pThr/pTyr-binding forkhead associated (FHA) protein